MIEASRDRTIFIETMRAVQSIKIFTREAERGAVWMNRYAGVVRAEAVTGFLKQVFRVANELIFGLENHLSRSARGASGGGMTVLFAFNLVQAAICRGGAVHRARDRIPHARSRTPSGHRRTEPEPANFRLLAYQHLRRRLFAITGSSGGGKTTLLKLILGLEPGEILVDGMPLRVIGHQELRPSVAS